MPHDVANGATEASAKAPSCGTPRSRQRTGPFCDSAPQLPIRAPVSADVVVAHDNGETRSTVSVNTTKSAQSHKEYLDSLSVPTGEELARLSSVQQDREKAKKAHARELKRRSADMARGSAEARRDFAEMLREKEKDARRSLDRRKKDGAGADAGDGNEDIDWAALRAKAATLIQRTYRGYRVRREMKGLTIDAGTRWAHAIRDARWRNINTPRAKGEGLTAPSSSADGSVQEGNEDEGEGQRSRSASASNARQNWKKAATIVKRAGGDEDSSHDSSEEEDDSGSDSDHGRGDGKTTPGEKAATRERKAAEKAKRQKKARVMGLQYFLEMVDLKHRYGSNLRQYHAEWKKADTNENFFYWLDYGAGRNVELTSCPRERLDRERVRYLSREERMYYLVKVDKEGRLCWAKNGIRIDTTEEWRDSIHGIVPKDDPTPAFAPAMDALSQGPAGASRAQREPRDRESPSSSSDGDGDGDGDSDGESGSSTSASESELEAARAAKYANPGLDEASGLKKVRHVSAATIFNKLLRKSVKKNTWIFVADTSFRLYVGIKDSGAFQHSSFLQGSRISAAGLIKIKNGRLASLSPLSGHYRPPASNFRAFVHSLRDEGVDMSHVSISKSYAVLVGLEAYVKTRKKGKETLQKLSLRKNRIVDPEGSAKRAEQERDKTQSAARERAFLEEQRREKDESRREDVMRKLGLAGVRAGVEGGEGRKREGEMHEEQGRA